MRPSSLFIDQMGNALVAGTTNSIDYPTTPPSSLRPDRLQLTANGDLFLTGSTASRDLPKAQPLAASCPLGIYPDIPYVARFSAEAKSLLGSRYVNDKAAYAAVSVTLDSNGFAQIHEGAIPEDLSTIPGYLCVVDPADNARLSAAASGQLITIFDDFAPDTEVTVNGIAAPTLYTSKTQMNIQVPNGLPDTGKIDLRAGPHARELNIVPRAPGAFLDLTKPISAIASSNNSGYSPGYATVMRNEDGSLNSCENPARRGSIVTIYLNGIGRTTPSFSITGPSQILALEPDPDSPNGVWRMRIQLAPSVNSGSLAPQIDGAGLRYPYLAVWIEP